MVTTSSTPSSQVFHGDDHEQHFTEYRSLSVLAILALVIGIIAPVAVAGPFLLVVPLVGIAVSLLALRRIDTSEGVLAGRWAATVGLMLSVASVVLPVSHYFIRQTIRTHQAENFGKSWIATVTSGEIEKAFRQTIDASRPAAPPEPGAPPRPEPLQAFRDNPVIKALQAAGPNADIRVRQTTDYQPVSYRNITVRQLYAVSPAAGKAASADSKPVEFVLSVQRGTLPRESMSRWMVTSFAPPKSATDASSQP